MPQFASRCHTFSCRQPLPFLACWLSRMVVTVNRTSWASYSICWLVENGKMNRCQPTNLTFAERSNSMTCTFERYRFSDWARETKNISFFWSPDRSKVNCDTGSTVRRIAMLMEPMENPENPSLKFRQKGSVQKIYWEVGAWLKSTFWMFEL